MAYKSIHETFWTDPVMKKELKPLERYLFSYFITSPHAHFSGLYYLAKATIMDETGLNLKELDRGMHTLMDRGILRFDERKDIIFVVNMLQYQVKNAKPNALQVKGIRSHMENLHNSFLINDFQRQWPSLSLDLEGEIDTPMDTPIGGVSDARTNKKKHKNKQNKTKQEEEEEDTKQEEEEDTKQVQEDTKKKKAPLSLLQDLWNLKCGNLFSKVIETSDNRNLKEVLRLKERSLEDWERVFKKINNSAFCNGRNDRGWKADYTWIMGNKVNAIKVLEGKYDNPKTPEPTATILLEARIQAQDERRKKLGVSI